ncbi:efflux transporter outer membrane subunit [Bradyrhizobium canariense]|uniref:Efflux transporter, outer membrane factor (OMF) lipoprotein, NodT family n=1 Tax=Bradyrhizobium canariense TaxID=255045 RepID=A0A1H1XXR0_9BRAD|nr:efflux transporter outer membrane subunit [Bradyrhizobium canariense]SDT14020.1 efflux transporter, outer membrane factor (OMF) lipoprotein, NodT family [Bradyrhizobium canariense]
MKFRALRNLLAAMGLSALVAGCMVGPDFVQPDSHLPEVSFQGDKGQVVPDARLPAPTDPMWWRVFRDPVLMKLEGQVAAANLDVQTATLRLAESRFQRGVAAAALFPSLNGDAKYNRELYSQNGIVSLIAPLAGPGFAITPINEYNTGFDASWEIDLWGKVRRQVEAADASVDQAADQRRDALVSSLAELARDYIQLRGVQTQIKIANDNLKVDRDVLSLTQERQQRGLQNALDVENAAAQVEGVRAQIPQLQQQESEYINALSFLLDEPPGALRSTVGEASVHTGPPRIPLGIPSELARRRPDIRAAEDQLHAVTANIGVAIGDFYPSIQFNGNVGFDSLEISNLYKPSSLQYTFGPSVTLPIFAGGRLRSTLNLRDAQQQEAAITYRKTVLQAWHEVVNALVAHRLEMSRRARLRAQSEHAGAALDLARTRYNDGVTEFLTVLDAERTLLQAEQQYATSTTNVSLDLVQLFKALGGGWETEFPDVPSETAAVPVPVATVDAITIPAAR